jgi:N-acetylneuraminate synthase/sialic acid synthase
MKGTDHAFSLEPQGMAKLVRDLERARIAQGDGVKRVFESEKAPLQKMGKALYASRDIDKGETLAFSDIELRSPGIGLEPSFLEHLVGKRLSRSIKQFEPFAESDAV